MRQHCKSQHRFDPMPNEDQKKPLFIRQEPPTNQTKVTLYSDPNRRSFSVVNNFLNLKKLGTEFTRAPSNENLVRSPNCMFNHLIDNYVFISKAEISGLSGYVCNECLAFQFHYIKDIGHDLTAEEKHRCKPSMVDEAQNLDKIEKLSELRKRATQSLSELANLSFPHVTAWNLAQQVTDRGFRLLIGKKTEIANKDRDHTLQ
jgi:hypothetical protein